MRIVDVSEVGLQADAIVGGVDVAAGDPDPAAIHDVDAVVVPIGIAFHSNAVNHEVLAQHISLHPTGRVLDRYLLDTHVLAVKKLDHLWPEEPFGALFGEFILYRVDLPDVEQAVDVQGQAAALAIKGALPGERDMFRLIGEEEGFVADAGIVVELDVLLRVGAAEDDSAFFQMEFDIGFEDDAAGEESPPGHDDPPTTAGVCLVDRRLNCAGIQCLSVSDCPMGYDAEVPRLHREMHQ